MTEGPVPPTASPSRDRFGLAAFVDALAATDLTPASGSGAAATGALAAALVASVARAAGDPGAGAQADALAARLTALVADDADAYEAAVRALGQTGDGSETHDFLLGNALRRAADVPLGIAEAAGDVALLAQAVADIAPAAKRADTVAAAFLAEGAARAAAHLVEVNLAARPGDERQTRARDAVATAAAAGLDLAGRLG